MWIGWVEPAASIAQRIKKPLPHVEQETSATKTSTGYAEASDSLPNEPEPVITVQFRQVRRVVRAAFIDQDVPLYVDARWKVEDVTAMLAASSVCGSASTMAYRGLVPKYVVPSQNTCILWLACRGSVMAIGRAVFVIWSV